MAKRRTKRRDVRLDGTITLDERLKTARRNVAAAKLTILAAPTQIESLDREIRRLTELREAVVSSFERAPKMLRDNERRLERLEIAIRQRTSTAGHREARSKLERLADKKRRLEQRLRELDAKLENLQ